MAAIRCPYCDTKVKSSSNSLSWTLMIGVTGNPPLKGFKEKLDDANEWIDIACPNPRCGRTFRYNRRTKEVRE